MSKQLTEIPFNVPPYIEGDVEKKRPLTKIDTRPIGNLGRLKVKNGSARQLWFEDLIRRISHELRSRQVPFRFRTPDGSRWQLDRGCIGHAMANGVLDEGAAEISRSAECVFFSDGLSQKKELEAAAFPSLANDLNDIITRAGISETTRRREIEARLGQGKFRDAVMSICQRACAVTGLTVSQALRASHIKPWRDCSNEERLDPENGLLLDATLDALFDSCLISFTDSGGMLISEHIPVADRALLKIPRSLRIRLTDRQKTFLRGHRTEYERRRHL